MAIQGEKFDSAGYIFFVRFVQVASFFAAALVAAANVWICVTLAPGVDSVSEAMNIVLRVFNVLFGFLIIFALFNFKFIARYFLFLLTYSGAGLFQMFVGILLLGAHTSYEVLANDVKTDAKTIDSVRVIAGWTLTGVGVIFLLMGILQFPHLKSRRELMKAARSADSIRNLV